MQYRHGDPDSQDQMEDVQRGRSEPRDGRRRRSAVRGHLDQDECGLAREEGSDTLHANSGGRRVERAGLTNYSGLYRGKVRHVVGHQIFPSHVDPIRSPAIRSHDVSNYRSPA